MAEWLGRGLQIPVQRFNSASRLICMYYPDVLYSDAHLRMYKGWCSDFNVRLNRHNRGLVKSTKPYRPWRLIYQETFPTRAAAFHREQYWKTATGAKELRQRLTDAPP